MKALIVGGGIGGLVAALEFHRAGIEVGVFESVRELKPPGVGLNLDISSLIEPISIRIPTTAG